MASHTHFQNGLFVVREARTRHAAGSRQREATPFTDTSAAYFVCAYIYFRGFRENVRRREAGRGRVETDGRGLKRRVGSFVHDISLHLKTVRGLGKLCCEAMGYCLSGLALEALVSSHSGKDMFITSGCEWERVYTNS